MFERSLGRHGKPQQIKRALRRRHAPLAVECLEKRELLAVFTPGNLAVLQTGDGTTVYTLAAPVSLNEVNPSSGAIVQHVVVPNNETAGGSGNQPLTLDVGTTAKSGAGSNGNGVGLLSTSFDSSVLTFSGNDAKPNTGSFSTDNRVIAQVGTDPVALNAFNTTTYGSFSGGDDTRGVVEASPTTLYEFGHTTNGGLRNFTGLTTGGSTVGTEVDTSATKNNVRAATVAFNGEVFYDSAKSTPQQAIFVGYNAGNTTPVFQPASPGTDHLILTDPGSSGNTNPNGLYVADMNGDGVLDAGDRLYFLDNANGLYESTYNGTTWSQPTVSQAIANPGPIGTETAPNYVGLTGQVINSTTVQLYFTNYDGKGNTAVYGFLDNGSNTETTTILGPLTAPATLGTAINYTGLAMVPKAQTSLTLSASPQSGTPGASITLTAQMSSPGAPSGVSGLVYFIDNNGTVLNPSGSTISGGVASFTTTSIPLGQNSIHAYCSGGVYNAGATTLAAESVAAATSATKVVAITGGTASAVSVTSASNVSTVGQAVTFTATVTPANPVPTGTVEFFDGSTSLGTVTLDGTHNTVSLSVSTLSFGAHSITADYYGNSTYQGSVSGSFTETVNGPATVTVSGPGTGTTTPGSTASYSATITGNGLNGSPTGTVSFYAYSYATGTSTLIETDPLTGSGGTFTATSSAQTVGVGSVLISATYNGNSSYASANTVTPWIETGKQAFARGDLIALDRPNQPSNASQVVALLEYTPAGSFVQAVALPDQTANGQNIFGLSGHASTEGALALSENGAYLTAFGFDLTIGTAAATSSNQAVVPRTVAQIDLGADVNTSTTVEVPTMDALGNVRAAVSIDGTQEYVVGDASLTNTGLQLATEGTLNNPPTPIGPDNVEGYGVEILGGNMYVSTQNATDPIELVGTYNGGIPTTATTLTPLPGLGGINGYGAVNFYKNNPAPYGFLLFNHLTGNSVNPDTLYVADQTYGLLKFSNDTEVNGDPTTGTWVLQGQKLNNNTSVEGLAGYEVDPGSSGYSFQLYATAALNNGNPSNQLLSFTDTAPYDMGITGGLFNVIANASNPTDTFSGLAFAPTYYASSTVVSSSVNPSPLSQAVTFTATVTDIAGTTAPTGTVTFTIGGVAQTPVNVTTSGGVTSATITVSNPYLTLGTHTVSAAYNGDSNVATSSGTLTQTVNNTFASGDLIVLRAGDGTPYIAQGPLFLDEYTPGGAVVESVPIPNNEVVGGTGNQPITIDLSAAAGNGQLTRSYDGSVLTFDGIDSGINNGTYVLPATPTGSANRVIAVAGNNPSAANFLNTTTYGAFYVGDDNRGSVAESATGPIWAAGHPNQAGGAVSQGVHYFATEGPSTGTQVSAGANIRAVTIGFDNRVYFSTAGSSSTGLAGIYTEGQALPTAANPPSDTQIVAALFTTSKLGGMYLADMNGDGVIDNGDRLYFLDDGTVGGAGTGGLYVSTYNTANPGNHWSTPVRLGDGPVQTGDVSGQLRGLTGTVLSPTEALLTVTEFDNVANNDSYILDFDDKGSGVSIANASQSTTGGVTTVTITTASPNTFMTGQTVEVDGVGASTGSGTLTAGYNGSWTITVVDSTHFTFTDTNTGAGTLTPVNDQGAADVTVAPTMVTSLGDGSITIAGKSYAAEGIRGVAYAPVAPTNVVLSASASTVSPGTPITFTVTLSNPQVTPTGNVTFIDQNTNTVLGQGTISTTLGVTTATFTTTLVGNHFISAYYAGGGPAELPSAASNTVAVDEAGSTASSTVLTTSLSAAATGVSVTLTATVADNSGGHGTPTGTVSFYNGSATLANLIGHATVSTVGSSQQATLTTTTLPLGANTIIAVYDGDNNFASSQARQTVTIAPNATATLTSSANNVAMNATPMYTVTVNGYATLGVPAGTVQFQLTNTFTGATSNIGSAVTLTPGSGNTATASVTSPALANPGSYLITVSFTPTGASNPYSGFAVNTTTSASGTAFIETVQQALHPGDLVAVQRGDGTTNLGSSGYLVFLVEYTQAGSLVQKIAMPDLSGGGSNALLLSGQNGAEGLLNRSANGAYLTLAGYDLPVGQQFVTSSFPFQFGRTIAEINLAGNVNTSTVITTTSSSSIPYNPLDVVSNDGNEFWLASNLPVGDTTESGIEYVSSLGASTATQLGPVDTSAASLAIAGGQLYAASNDVSGGSAVGVWKVGTGLPTAATTLTTLPGLQAAYQFAFPNAINPEQLLFLNTNDGTSNNPNVLYIADLSNGLLKFWFDGSKWNYGGPGGTFGEKLVFSGGAAGVSGYVINPGPSAEVQLYVTGSNVPGANPNQIASFLDTNAFNAGFVSGNFATVVFVGQTGTGAAVSPNGNENFAGLAFAPGYATMTTLNSSVNPAPNGTNPTFSVTVTSPSAPSNIPTGTVTFSIDGVAQPAVLLGSSGMASFTPSPALSPGHHTITATYSGDVDDDTSSTTLAQIDIGPFAGYNVAVVGSSTIQAGSNFIVTVQAADAAGDPITSYTGPGTVTATISPTSTASSFPTTVAINSFGFGLFLADLQKAGTYTITVANGSFSGSASPVTVTAGPAAKVGFGTQPVNTPTGVTLPAVTVQVLDSYGNVVTTDNSDTVNVTVASGPGTFTAGSTTAAAVHNGVATFSNLTLVQPGSYTLNELVTSLYTGPNSAAFTVTPLQVLPSSFASSPSGFSLAFNAPFLVNSTTPVLFGTGFGSTAPAPSVTLTGPDGPVEGSLVLNTATNSLTFVETDTASVVNNSGSPILPDGTYTVDVRSSGATGFQSLNSGGGYLDGLASGMPGSGDFTKTFTINAAAANDNVLWIPATADGPGQPLEAPGNNQSGGGYPLYLNTATGSAPVTDVQATLSYNPALLTVTPTSTSTFTVTVPTAGTAVLHYHGVGLSGTQVIVGVLTATVPSGTMATPTPYKAKDLLHLSGVTINGSASSVATADALHLVAYVGDGDGNGAYSSNDAVLITRVALQTDSGFTAYPLVDPVVVADTDGSGFIPADAPLQVNEAGVGFTTANLSNPPIPAGVVFQAIGNNVDPSLSIQGSEVRGQGSEGVDTVSVNIDNAHPAGSTGLIEAHLALTYDPSVFSVSAADVHLGSVLAAGSDWSVNPTISPLTGQIAIALSSTMPITSTGGGSLVTIDFHLAEGVRGQGSGGSGPAQFSSLTPDPWPLTPVLLVASVKPDGQYVMTELEDAQGAFTLTPAPVNGFDPRIDGVAMLSGSPTAVSVSASVVEVAPVADTVSLETAAADRVLVTNASAGTASLPAPVSESEEPNLTLSPSVVEDAAPVHISALPVHAAAALASPLTGLLFQVASTTLPTVAATTGVASGPHLADQLFQALVRGTNNSTDTLPMMTMKDIFERVLTGQFLSQPSLTDDLDGLNWNELGGDLDVQRATNLANHVDRSQAPVSQTNPSATATQANVDQTALDQYFAQTASVTEEPMDVE